ncbi:site-specific DNA-methyltransferase [Flavihumibacter sediminis]|nr:site-specific DNA-methyltransferase [Flavihumibacter sediminis]
MIVEGTSLDITRDLIQKLREIIPGAFIEDKINVEQLKQLLGEAVNADLERYQLSWAGKSEAYKNLQTPTTETLIPNIEASVNWDSANNIMIEGENLKVLKVLQKSYYGKVKFVSIDPPYNTGTDSFIYPDKFSETKEEYLKRLGEKDDEGYMMKEGLFRPNRKENGQFHSNWLSMMLPRLFLARNLLKEDGAIIIHIDEHELANLTLLLNEVFGEDNLIGNIVWDKGNPKGDASGIAYQHESILVYSKSKEKFLGATDLIRKKKNAEKILKKAGDLYKLLGKEEIPDDLKKLHKEYGLPEDTLKKFKRKYTLDEVNTQFNAWLKKQDLTGGELAYNKIDSEGNVYRLVSMAWPNKKKAPDDYFVPLIHPMTNKPCPVPQRGWRFPTATIKDLLSKGEILFGTDESVQPQRKYLLKENMYENLPSILFFGGSDDDLLRKLELEFENPKPVEFTKSLIQAFTKSQNSDIILDFFAGSGTTAHAVIEANKQDAGNRKFICIQLPEQLDESSEMYKKGYRSIADLTIARIKAVIKRANAESANQLNFDNSVKIGVRCFSLGNSNFKVWRGDFIESEADLITQMNLFTKPKKDNSISINILWELLIKSGVALTEQINSVKIDGVDSIYLTNNNRIAFCIDVFNERILQELLKQKPHTVICLDSLFNSDDCHKTNSHLNFQDNGIEFKTI